MCIRDSDCARAFVLAQGERAAVHLDTARLLTRAGLAVYRAAEARILEQAPADPSQTGGRRSHRLRRPARAP
eukprot:5567067-Alexandrium_andersonii.AAC.1